MSEGPGDTIDKIGASDRCLEFPPPADRPAAAAFVHHPRHYHQRRLCLAEGPELAGSAARSLGPRPGYPEVSRNRERLYRQPARPYLGLAEEAGRRNARAH